MELLAVDGHDADQFERFHGLREEIQRAEQEFPTALGLREARVMFTGTHSDVRVEGLAAVDGDTWLGIAWLDWWLQENTHAVGVELAVAPAYRRRGVGSRLLDAVVDRVRQQGRTQLLGQITADAVTGKSTGTAFAERRGFVQRHVELHQVMELPLSEDRLAELEQRIAGKDEAYRLVQWRDRTPDEWVDEFADALSVMSEEVPTGDLQLEPSRWTAARVREVETRRLEQGRFWHTTVAVASDGKLAAYTQLGGAKDQQERLYQWDTLVRPAHRGHRLGMALKLANLRSVQAELEKPVVVHTWNAPENGPMIAVNNHLGFRPVDQSTEWQRDL
jgi:GNAT superfamily N-acetyltransferase